MSFSVFPALFKPSKAIPAVIAPSPITAIALDLDLFILKASDIPNAADIDVLECPVPKLSKVLSDRLGKPEMPSFCLSVYILSLLPVKIL